MYDARNEGHKLFSPARIGLATEGVVGREGKLYSNETLLSVICRSLVGKDVFFMYSWFKINTHLPSIFDHYLPNFLLSEKSMQV